MRVNVMVIQGKLTLTKHLQSHQTSLNFSGSAKARSPANRRGKVQTVGKSLFGIGMHGHSKGSQGGAGNNSDEEMEFSDSSSDGDDEIAMAFDSNAASRRGRGSIVHSASMQADAGR